LPGHVELDTEDDTDDASGEEAHVEETPHGEEVAHGHGEGEEEGEGPVDISGCGYADEVAMRFNRGYGVGKRVGRGERRRDTNVRSQRNVPDAWVTEDKESEDRNVELSRRRSKNTESRTRDQHGREGIRCELNKQTAEGEKKREDMDFQC
jgi:hypothetical protein